MNAKLKNRLEKEQAKVMKKTEVIVKEKVEETVESRRQIVQTKWNEPEG